MLFCVALFGAMAARNASAQTDSSDVAVATMSSQDPSMQSDLERLQRIERVQAELQTEIAAIRKRMAGRTGEGSPRVVTAPESTTPQPPAEGPSAKSSINDSKVARLPELASVEEERWRFFFGGELLYVQPRWTTNPAYAERINGTPPNFSSSTSQKNFDHDFKPSPVITAGIVGPNGLGLRGRYWWLDSDANPQAAATTGTGTLFPSQTFTTAFPLGLGIIGSSIQNGADHTLAIRNSLRIQTGDAELTWTRMIGPATFLLSGGARYANIRQGYDADDVETFTQGPPLTSRLRSSHRMEGFGPTLSADVTFPLGWGGLSLYADGRGSIIFGEDREEAILFSDHRELSQNVAMSTAELEGGVGWSHSFDRFGVELRAGVVGQMWFNAGNGANNENIIGVPANNFFGGAHDQTVDPNANLGLIGFEFASTVHF